MPSEGARGAVFLVHGRDLDVRGGVVRFLTDLGLRVVGWEEAIALTGRPAPHAREVLEAALRNVSAIVVLFTGDDEARLRSPFCRLEELDVEGTLAPQPRPNVLFEAGLAFALFPQRTVVLQVGRLRPLSDLAGIQFIPLDESAASRRSFVNRLRIAGCQVRTPPAGMAEHGLPGSSAGLPAMVQGRASESVALLRRVHSFFFGPQFGGALELAERARVGDELVLSLRLASEVDDYRAVHWLPGSATPALLPLDRSQASDRVRQISIKMTGPAGVHVVDLRARDRQSHEVQVVARARCIVEEA
jgi:hypothetical protein